MVHSKTHYSIWKDVQEESHLEDFCHCGFTGVSFSEAKLVSLSQRKSNIKAQDSIMPGIIESWNEKPGWKQVE